MNRAPPVEFGHFLLPFLLWAFLRLTRGTGGAAGVTYFIPGKDYWNGPASGK